MRKFTIAVALLFVFGSYDAIAQTCGGNLVDQRNIYLNPGAANQTKIGELQLYYNPQNGNNCAQVKHGGPTWGVKLWTAVSLGRCENRQDRVCNHNQSGNVPGQFQVDIGEYIEYAGPVRLHTPNSCVRAAGYIQYQGEPRWADTIYGHCG